MPPFEIERRVMKKKGWSLLGGLAVLAVAISVAGENPTVGQGPPPGEGRRQGPPRRRHRRSAEDMRRWFEDTMRRIDANQNGLLESAELGDRERRRFVESMVRRAGMEPKFPVSIKQLRERLERNYRPGGAGVPGPNPEASDRSGAGSRSVASTAPLVPSFGVEADRPAVAGFGTTIENRTRITARPSTRSSPREPAKTSASGTSGNDTRREYRKYAKSLLRQYDLNGNGMLEEDEWKEMKQRHWAADRDGDKVITLDELTDRQIEYSKRASDGSRSSSRGSPKSGPSKHPSRRSHSPRRRSYRFLTPQERLPEGLPDWFARQDADGDGQVSMAEYSGYWDDRKAAAFVRCDRNNDGIITPTECLEMNDAL